ncbi:FHA domain-containing protein [Desulfotomaculum arcticum]|uniref:FHA domain-containing protein n=1 Tax=Desulfotruncus arcticus DSM 17038 TaxID=1121424 RepID=A0A1I2R7T5_9FIRM|nr:DUF3662 and FHA domain-containing protein [Desulfotruncus arcticus]SFG36775.1 FHA domain-containing protein [Desulfotomaculum arcticum] [Desulfotruncus arcticus DSM 17038]
MGFLSELEGSLERIIEGFFKDKFKGSLQPVDMAKRLAREMREQRRTGLKDIFVPNRYEIFLNPGEYNANEPVIEHLSGELQEYVAGKAAEKKYTLLGRIEVSFDQDQAVAPGEMVIKSYFDEEENDVEEESAPVSEATMQYVPIKGEFAPSARELPEAAASLEVLEGPLSGRRYQVEGNLAVIGRKESCDIFLPDESISRRHALISRVGRQFYIKDQASTNGTYINGARVEQEELMPGDMIKIGRILLRFRVE